MRRPASLDLALSASLMLSLFAIVSCSEEAPIPPSSPVDPGTFAPAAATVSNSWAPSRRHSAFG
jgi:hypothetical protein